MTVLPGVMAEWNFYIREAADTSTIESWSLTVPGVWNNTREHELSGKASISLRGQERLQACPESVADSSLFRDGKKNMGRKLFNSSESRKSAVF